MPAMIRQRPIRLRALYAALVLALGTAACSKSGQALLVVTVSAPGGLPDVRSVEVTVSNMTGGLMKQDTVSYPAPDGSISIPKDGVTLGVRLPGDAGSVMVAVRAFGADAGKPLAAGTGGPIEVHAGERASVDVVLGASGGEGGAGSGGGAGAGDGGAGSGGSGGAGSGGSAGTGSGGAGTGGGGAGSGGGGAGSGGGSAGSGGAGGGGGATAGTGGGGAGGACSPNLDTDTHHCGACDHDCVFGTCSGGVCQKELFAPADTGSTVIVGDPTNLYWIHQGAVWQRRLDEGDTARKVSNNVGPVVGLLTNGSFIYYGTSSQGMDSGSAVRIPAGGGTSVTIATDQGSVPYLAFVQAQTELYWVARGAMQDTVWKAQMDGANRAPLATETSSIRGFAVQAYNTYWATADSINGPGFSPTMPPSSVVYMMQASPHSLLFDGSHLIWANSGPMMGMGTIMSSNRAGNTTPMAIQSGINGPSFVVSDGVSAYFTDGDLRLVKVPLDPGGVVVPRSLGTGAANGLYVDGTMVYWSADGAIYRVAKF
jgi:hypothetical protein